MEKEIFIIKKLTAPECGQASEFANKKSFFGSILPVSAKWLVQHKNNYFVALKNGVIAAICGSVILPGRIPEIRTLVVEEGSRRAGLGSNLIKLCLDDITSRNYRSCLALTITPRIFEKNGFVPIDINLFPQKIWRDCRHCPRNAGGPLDPRCNEKPMFLKL